MDNVMQDEPHIPDEFARDLREEFRPPVIPSGFDQALLRHARSHLMRRNYHLWRWAAALLLSTGLGAAYLLWPDPMSTPPSIALDINQDQRVDILDALTLARRDNASQTDVRHIAMAAVRLEEAR